MILPVQTTFRNISHSDAAVARIQEEADKLDSLFDRITSCRVVVEAPHRHHRTGRPFHIRIELGLPRKELVVTHEPGVRGEDSDENGATRHKALDSEVRHQDVHAAIADAFKTMRRQLQDYADTLGGRRKGRKLEKNVTEGATDVETPTSLD